MHSPALTPMAISLASATTLACEGANGLSFYLPVEPLCGRPESQARRVERKTA